MSGQDPRPERTAADYLAIAGWVVMIGFGILVVAAVVLVVLQFVFGWG